MGRCITADDRDDTVDTKRAHPVDPGRWADGTLRQGFSGPALKSGVYSAGVKRHEVPTDLRQSIDAFRAGLISDQGGASELSTIQAGYLTRLCDVEVCCRLIQNDLVTRGLFTAKHRVRSTFDKFLLTIGTWDRLAQRIGMDRRARQVPSLAEFLEQRSGEAAVDATPTED